MRRFWRLLAFVMLGLRLWKHLAVVRFLRRRVPSVQNPPRLISIIQPILSGDPALPTALRRNLEAASSYPREFLWLIDSDDSAAQLICDELAADFPNHTITTLALEPPQERQNPKTIKLIAGASQAQGDLICVLDDDTVLPDQAFEECLPSLEQPDAGLAFGLPYYHSFENAWSTLVTLFVNSQSLLTYIPYTALTEPFTINGMFYVIRREILDAVGGFTGLESILADDFAVAQRMRNHGYRLIQSPLRHAIGTHVEGASRYLSLIQRWFIFPRESLLRHLGWQERALVYAAGVAPALFPAAVLAALVADRSAFSRWYALGYHGLGVAQFSHINRVYLRNVTPTRYLALVPLIETLFPFQLLAALLAPQRINWRGHVMDVEQGGQFRFVRRR